MAAPFLAGLSARARRAYPIVRRAVREGLSANQTQLLLQRNDMGFRRRVLLDMFRFEKGIQLKNVPLRTLGRSRFPDPSRLGEAITKIRRAFSFQLEVSGASIQTGETLTRFVTVTTDRLMTRAELEDMAGRTVAGDTSAYELDLQAVQLVGGLRAGEAGTL